MKLKAIIVVAAAFLIFLSVWSVAQQTVRVAVLPFTVHSAEDLTYLRNGVWDIISTRLIAEGKIAVVEKPLVERFFADLRGDVSDQQARWLGSRVGADYVVYGSITKVGEYISLDAKIVHVPGARATSSAFSQHKGMDDVMTKVGTFAQDISSRILGHTTSYERGAGPAGQRLYLSFQALGYSKLMSFPKRILKGVDVGDVDGDGKNEIVVTGEHKIWVYRDEGGKEMKTVAEFDASQSENFLTLDVIDINGDKKADICVTNAIGDNLQSFILTYEDGAFRYLAKGLDWYLRVVKVPGQGDSLLAQRMGSDKDYEGSIRPVQWNGKKVKLGKRLKQGKKEVLPKEAEWIVSFTSGKFTSPEAQREFLVLDDMGKLRLLDDNGDLHWKSSDDLGGSDNYVDRPKVLADKRGAQTFMPRRIYFPPRILARDLDGDGIDDVVAVVNKFTLGDFLSKVRMYDKGYVAGLTWDGMTLANVWRTQDIAGYVADFQIRDVDNDGRDEVVIVAVSSHFLGSEAKGILLVFEIYE